MYDREIKKILVQNGSTSCGSLGLAIIETQDIMSGREIM